MARLRLAPAKRAISNAPQESKKETSSGCKMFPRWIAQHYIESILSNTSGNSNANGRIDAAMPEFAQQLLSEAASQHFGEIQKRTRCTNTPHPQYCSASGRIAQSKDPLQPHRESAAFPHANFHTTQPCGGPPQRCRHSSLQGRRFALHNAPNDHPPQSQKPRCFDDTLLLVPFLESGRNLLIVSSHRRKGIVGNTLPLASVSSTPTRLLPQQFGGQES